MSAALLSSRSRPRDLDPAEAYYHALNPSWRMSVLVVAELHTDPGSVAVRQALDRLQATTPLLRTGIHRDQNRGVWQFASCEQSRKIPLTVEVAREALLDDSGEHGCLLDVARAALMQPFSIADAPLCRVCLVRAATGRSALIALFHHAICDGKLALDWVRAMVDPRSSLSDATSSGHELPPGVHSCFPAERLCWLEPGQIRSARARQVREMLAEGRLTSIPWLLPSRGGFSPVLRTLRLEGEAVSRLRSAARLNGSSVHGVVSACHLLAVHEALSAPPATTLLLTSAVDLRGQLAAGALGQSLGLAASNVHGAFRVMDGDGLWSLAARIARRTREQVARGDAHMFYSQPDIRAALEAANPEEALLATVTRAPPATVVSSPGVFESRPGCQTIKAVAMFLPPGPRHTLFSCATTFDGSLVLASAYDSGSVEACTVGQLVASTHAKLRQACSP